MVVCVVLKCRCVCKWGLKLGVVYVSNFMVGYRLVICERRKVCISPMVKCV